MADVLTQTGGVRAWQISPLGQLALQSMRPPHPSSWDARQMPGKSAQIFGTQVVAVAGGVFVGVLVGVFVGVLVGVSVGVLVAVFVGVLVGVNGTQTLSKQRANVQSASVQHPPGGRQAPLQTS
jgi:hypothetical protein